MVWDLEPKSSVLVVGHESVDVSYSPRLPMYIPQTAYISQCVNERIGKNVVGSEGGWHLNKQRPWARARCISSPQTCPRTADCLDTAADSKIRGFTDTGCSVYFYARQHEGNENPHGRISDAHIAPS